MDPDFWHARWEQGQHGFHQSAVNPNLVEYWSALGLAANDRVFVPLCGKSLDLWWLRNQGHSVVGVELSAIAVRDFFEEAAVEPSRTREGSFTISEIPGIRIYQGNFFDLRVDDLAGVRGVYDRAALIALPPNLRHAYARALAARLPRPVGMLVLAFESSTPDIAGPPFSVAEAEIRELYEPAFRVEVLHRSPLSDPSENLRARGHGAVADIVYAIRA